VYRKKSGSGPVQKDKNIRAGAGRFTCPAAGEAGLGHHFVIISDDVAQFEKDSFCDKPVRYDKESDQRKMGDRHCNQGILY